MSQAREEEEVGKLVIRLANAVVLPMVLKSALELNLVDIIAASTDGVFLSTSEIATRIATNNPDAPILLDRMLRLLASYDVLKCSVRTGENGEVERVYGAAPICKFLVKNPDGGSVAPLFLLHHDKGFMESWYILFFNYFKLIIFLHQNCYRSEFRLCLSIYAYTLLDY